MFDILKIRFIIVFYSLNYLCVLCSYWMIVVWWLVGCLDLVFVGWVLVVGLVVGLVESGGWDRLVMKYKVV